MAIQIDPFVEFRKIEIICPDRPKGNIEIDLNAFGANMKELAAQSYTLKEGSKSKLRVTFKVHNTVVLGLKICSVIDTSVKLFKDTEVLGTFAPNETVHVEETDWNTTPEGFFKRGEYKGKVYFADADGLCHLQYDFKIKIAKNWD